MASVSADTGYLPFDGQSNKQAAFAGELEEQETKLRNVVLHCFVEEEKAAKDDLLALDIETSGLKDLIPAEKIRAGIKFTLEELVEATDNFSADRCLGEGIYGQVYKGFLKRLNKDVTVRQLKLEEELEAERIKKFATEIVMLSVTDHPNIIKLLGYCIAEEVRLLVYDFVPLGLLDHHLLDLAPDQQPLDWTTRMKIAVDVARCLEYLHQQKIIFQDLRCPNILLGEDHVPKLFNFGLATIGIRYLEGHFVCEGGFGAPELVMGFLTFESDIFCFGEFLLQLITGRKFCDEARAPEERVLIIWARSDFKHRKEFPLMADPLLKGQYPHSGWCAVFGIAGRCTSWELEDRPSVSELVKSLENLASENRDTELQTFNSLARVEEGSIEPMPTKSLV